MIWFVISLIILLGSVALVARFALTARAFNLVGAVAGVIAGLAIGMTLARDSWLAALSWATDNIAFLALALAVISLALALSTLRFSRR